MPRPISYAVFCLNKKSHAGLRQRDRRGRPTRPLLLRHASLFQRPATTDIYTLSLHDALPIFHDETGRLNVDGMNIISNDGSNKLNRSRKARVSYKVQRTINASLNAATSTRAVSSNPNFVTRQKIEIIFG